MKSRKVQKRRKGKKRGKRRKAKEKQRKESMFTHGWPILTSHQAKYLSQQVNINSIKEVSQLPFTSFASLRNFMNAFVHLRIGRCAPSQAWEMFPIFLWEGNGIHPFSLILFVGPVADQFEFEDHKNHHPFQRSNLQASYGFLELVFGVKEDIFFHDDLRGI